MHQDRRDKLGLFERIDVGWKAWAALAAAVALGFTVGTFLTGFHSLPMRVEQNERAVQALQSDFDAFRVDLKALEKEMRLSNCLELSERSGASWRNCLDE